ncbi:MAG: GtrA family protein [Bryobacteraceae bacterium]|nr:GtrA family protein [Bryobacteraceae bacterium]
MSAARPSLEWKPLARRWLRFNAVGAGGIAVQLAALALYKSGLGLHYLAATALAVETAVLHNFVWHERWTWRERTADATVAAVAGRLFRFHVSNGLVSILSNVVLMRIFAGYFHLHYLPANAIAIAITSLANFALSEWFVFARPGAAGSRQR